MEPSALQILKHLVEIKRRHWLDYDSIEKFQKERLAGMLQSAYQAGHYKTLMDGNSLAVEDVIDNLSLLPLTKKEDIMENPDSFIAKGFSKGKLLKISTSGSTGTPLEIFLDKEAREYRIALVYDTETLFGRSPFELFAHITFETYPQNPLLSMTGLFPKLRLSSFEEEEKNFSRLEKAGAKMLRSYPSTLTIMAKLNDDKSRPLRFKSVYSSAEMLTKEARELIGDSFSCPVLDQYGSLEFRSIAWECPEEHNMHINCSSCIVEIIDENGKPKKNGVGDIVVTSLHNRAMPFLRYHIGDLGSWGKECSCGRSHPVLKSLKGRRDDLIILPSGRIRSAFSILPMTDMKDILSFQIIQERPDLFVFRFVPAKQGPSEQSRKEVVRRIKGGCLGEEVTVEFEEVQSIKRGRTGKIRAVVSKVSKGSPD